jgi:hypothetical protein
VNRLLQSEREHAAALAVLAATVADLADRARANTGERDGIVDALVTLGFDDSGELGSIVDRIGGGQ